MANFVAGLINAIAAAISYAGVEYSSAYAFAAALTTVVGSYLVSSVIGLATRALSGRPRGDVEIAFE